MVRDVRVQIYLELSSVLSKCFPLQGSAWREEKLIEETDVDDALLRRLVGELTEVVSKAGENAGKRCRETLQISDQARFTKVYQHPSWELAEEM